MAKTYNVLWSGGWDSTFRIIQLYRKGVTIQPIYVIDTSRKSLKKEMEVMDRLKTKIPNRFKKSNGKLLPLLTFQRKKIPYNPLLKFVYKKLKKRISLGKQYYWLATVAKKFPELELAAHKEDRERLFYEDQLIKITDDKVGTNWKINPKKIDFYKGYLFKNMTFPLISISKNEMKKIAIENNFLDLLESTWFCHKSVKKPCGKCTPCKQYIRDGFGYLVH